MNIEAIVFYLFAAILLLAALCVITARNPVHAALFLVLSFFTASAIWLLLRAEFLALTLMVVYVGAVMVLFLFVVMMLDINLDRLREGFWSYLPLGAAVGVLMVVEMVLVLGGKYFGVEQLPSPADPGPGYSNTKALGRILYTDYVYPFELAAVILLVAIVAAIALTIRRRKDTKKQDPSKQVMVKRSDRVRLISMPSEEGVDRAVAIDTRAVAVALPDPGAAVRYQHRRHFPQSQERHHPADGDRTDAARGEPELHRFLALPERHFRAGIRVFHSDGGGGRVGHRPGDPGGAVPQFEHDQRRRSEYIEGLRGGNGEGAMGKS
jgi:NADH-quinone oxidoreductase subunit J